MTTLHEAAKKGDTKFITEWMLKMNNPQEIRNLLNKKDAKENTVLHLAAINGHIEVVTSLITHVRNNNQDLLKDFLNARNRSGRTALEISARIGHLDVTAYLLENFVSCLKKRDAQDYDKTLLPSAACYCNKDVVESLVQRHVRDYLSSSHDTSAVPVYHRGKKTSQNRVQESIRNFINSTNNDGENALHWAAYKGDMPTLTYLLQNGADYNTKDKSNMTPLLYAALIGHNDVILSLLNHVQSCANSNTLKHYINEQDGTGCRAIHYAATKGDLETIMYLLATGADYNTKNKANKTPLLCAAENGRKDVVLALLMYVQHNNPDVLKDCINQDSDDSCSILRWAVIHGHVDIVQYLLSHGTDYSTKNTTPLHDAANWGRMDVVIALLTHVRNSNPGSLQHYVNKKDNRDNTALHYAAELNQVQIVTFLLANGAEYNTTNIDNMTPLHAAAWKGYTDVVVSILTHVKGQVLRIQSDVHRNPGLLEDYVNIKDNWGYTPLHYASEYGHGDIVMYLLGNGAQYNTKDSNNKTPLHDAAGRGHTDVVVSILTLVQSCHLNMLELYVNKRDNMGFTALHYADEYNHADVVTYLLKNGAKCK